jgi:serine/threonine protein kinase/tetratricopeptide (TPR) repeat protein
LPESQPSKRPFSFGPFELDAVRGELRKRGVKVKLQDQPFQILQILLEHPGEIVTREELRKRIWPADTFVDFDKGLYNAIKKLREALGDEPSFPRYVETVPKRGYRFIAPLDRSVQENAAAQPDPALVKSAETNLATVPVIGQTIAHYRIVEKLGGGGMGVVYEAEDIRLKRHVALKFLPDKLAHDSRALQRFKREAHAASSLNHPSICTIYEVEEQDGQPVIVMELLEGESLKARIHDRPISAEELLDLGIQTSDALAAAHAKGIIHRDIKPGNIFMTGAGRMKILDFGVAKTIPGRRLEIESDDESLTAEGIITGTTAYMSPEQVRGEEIDARSDLFSLGVVLYEAATGQRPFVGKNPVLIMNAILNEEPAPLGRVNSELPAALDTIIAKALEKDREHRYQSAMEMRADLERLRRDSENPFTVLNGSVKDNGAAQPGPVLVMDSNVAQKVKPAPPHLYSWKILVSAAVLIVVVGAGVWYWHVRLARKLTEKDTIVLADFANSTGDAIFDDTLKTALNISLRQSPFLNVLPDGEVAKTLQLMTLPSNTKLTPEVASELCQRVGSKAYLAGAIGSLGSEYVLGLKAANCQSGNTLAEEQVTVASKEKVLDALGKVASKLRRELGESLATVQKFDVPLAQATTSSLEALREYSLSLRAIREQGIAAALPYRKRAIELDPNFAIVYLAAGNDYWALGQLASASEYYTKAFQLREHASEWEKLKITSGYYFHVTGQLDKAAQTYQEEVENYSRQPGSYSNLSLVLAAQGQHERAAEFARQAVRLAPDRVEFYENLANFTLALQRVDETRQVIHEALARKMDDSQIHSVLYGLGFLEANSRSMAGQQKWFADNPQYEHYGLALASDTEAYSGHLRKARELTKRAVNSAVRADSKENGAIWQAINAQWEAVYGNVAQARQSAVVALKSAPTSMGAAAEAAFAFAMAGDTARSEYLTHDLGRRFPLDTQMQSRWLPAIQAQLALDKKDPSRALRSLQAASAIELGQIPFVNNISCLYPVYVRGEAYLATGQGSAAAAEFQRILDHSGIVWNCWTGALAHLGVARANALQARTSQGADADASRVRALAAYKDFLTLWRDAEPDIPLLKEAKAEYAKLQ